MANLKPAHGNVSTVSLALTTASVTPGVPLCYVGTPGDGGYLGPGAPTSAVGIIAVCAETKNGAATGRSALASANANGDEEVLCYPATVNNRFLAVCSSTPTQTMMEIAFGVAATGVIANETTAEPQFVIEEIVDATAKTVIGRFVGGGFTTRVLYAVGT